MKTIKVLSGVSVLLAASPASAILSMTNPLPDIIFDEWSGSTGDLVGIADICIISTRGNSSNPRNYDAAGYKITPAGGADFVIEHTVSGDQLDITYQFLDASGTTHTLTNYSVTGFVTPLIAGAANCTQGAAQIMLTLPAAELASAEAGIYTASLGFDILQSGGGTYTGVVNYQATMPELAEITHIDDVSLLGPIGVDITATEDFCIFRNGASGFSITATGSNDAGGTFNLADVGLLPYSLEVGQGGTFFDLLPGVGLSSSTTGMVGMSVRDCGGADNATLRFTISNTDAQAAPYGNYSDTLTVLIVPD